MICSHDKCTATFQRVRWESGNRPHVGSLTVQDAVTREAVAAFFVARGRALAALDKERAKEDRIAISDCGEICMCLFDWPNDEQFDYRESTIRADFSALDSDGRIKDYFVTYKVLRATVSVFGSCAALIAMADDSPMTFAAMGMLLEQQLSKSGVAVERKPCLADYVEGELVWELGGRAIVLRRAGSGLEDRFRLLSAPDTLMAAGPNIKPLTSGAAKLILESASRFFSGKSDKLVRRGD
jgi:hypothetical protein